MTDHLKPDIDVVSKHIERDHNLMFILCFGVIVLAVVSFIMDWPYKAVFVAMAVVSFIMLGGKKDIPNESWSPQQKGAWTKRYTTLKIKDGKLTYIAGDSSSDKEVYELSDIDPLKYESNKLLIIKNGAVERKISTKYWLPEKTQEFIFNVNEEISKNT